MSDLNKPHEPRCTRCEKVICGEGIYWKNTKDFFHPDCDLLYRTTHPKLWRYLERDELYSLWKIHGKPESYYRKRITCPCGKIFHDLGAFGPHVKICKKLREGDVGAVYEPLTEQPSQPCSYSEPPPKPDTTTTTTSESVCAEADRIINGERRSDYGPVEESFQDYAAMWSVIFKCSVTPSQVALAMACLKICRELNGHKRDSVVDAIGYLALTQKIEENKEPK